jgi:RNA polymerase sigma factor (sigma-70 family)
VGSWGSSRCPPDADLSELIRRALGGDSSAQIRLFESCVRPEVRAVVLDILLRWRGMRRNLSQECEDLVQDALEHLLEVDALSRWDPKLGSFAGYVRKIASNKTLKTLCTKKRNPWSSTPMEDRTIEALLPGEHGTGESITVTRNALVKVAETVGEDGMRLLFLFYVEGLTAREVAEIVNKREDAVDKARQRLCEAARKMLSRDQVSGSGASAGRGKEETTP